MTSTSASISSMSAMSRQQSHSAGEDTAGPPAAGGSGAPDALDPDASSKGRPRFVYAGMGLPFALLVTCFASWGMSTVMEAIALHQLGVRVAGMSIVSDLSFAQAPTDPDEVVRLAAAAHATIAAGIQAVLAAMS